tara:strand:- start:2688 stop:2858 length:171 start_codon:yes stop_codon:yes gene_type:complete
MEVYDRKTGEWKKVNSENFSEKVMKIYDYMTAEMQILERIDIMNEQMGIDTEEDND